MIFVNGWACHRLDSIERIRLYIDVESGFSQVVDAEMGYRRDDVAARFSGLIAAQNAGFLILGGWGPNALRAVRLVFEFAYSAPHEIALYPSPVVHSAFRVKLNGLRLMFSKGMRALKSQGLRSTWTKARDYGRRRSTEDATALATSIAQMQGHKVVWIVDHDMGGGANLYRQQFVQTCLSEGQMVVVLGFQVASLGYFVQFHRTGGVDRHAISTLDDVRTVLRQLQIVQLVYNCAVSFRDPLQVCRLLVSVRDEVACKLVVLIHDYFSICPSHVLLNAKAKFCELPDPQTCNDCLATHSGGFVSMTHTRDIGHWRNEWRALIELADEVQVFSPSSWELLARAYPTTSQRHWRLLPHTLLTPTPVLDLQAGMTLHIGVVGTLGFHKGADLVAKLSQEIHDAKLNIPITVFGTIQTREPLIDVNVTGAYSPDRLAEMIEASGSNVFLLPSIWPETFSYVAHELCAMGVPLVCFDMGAQADLVKCYVKGQVVALFEPSVLLAELVRFWETSYVPKNKLI